LTSPHVMFGTTTDENWWDRPGHGIMSLMAGNEVGS
jgi:hypothetical protein